MARLVIGGIVDCPIFAHVDYVAYQIADNYPDFQVKKYMFKEADYQIWLAEVNEKNGWHHQSSPIVWKELSMYGGAAKLVGGASEFWEYCYEYYGIQSDLTRHDMDQLALDNLQKLHFAEMKAKETRMSYKIRRVCISGAAHPMARLLISDLLRIPGLPKKDGLVVFLYDCITKREKLVKLKEDAGNIGAHAGLGTAIVEVSLGKGLHNCDLYIILDDYPRLHEESMENWLERNQTAMLEIADELNEHAPKKCRVILATPGDAPLCFNATVLIENLSKIPPENVVAVTADLGLSALHTLARAASVPMRCMSAPPVWGFIGVNKFVDLHGTLHAAVAYRPNARSVKRPVKDSTLPLGRYQLEIRRMGYLLHKIPNLWLQVQRHTKESIKLLNRGLIYPKAKATMDMLRFWYSKKYNEEIISLGVCSNEFVDLDTFQLPWGMNFSQPVCLENDHWVPCKEYPLPFDPYCDVRYLVLYAGRLLERLNIGRSYKANWVLTKGESAAKEEVALVERQLRLFQNREEIQQELQMEREREAERERRMEEFNAQMALEVEQGERRLIAEHAVETLLRAVMDVCLPYPPPPAPEPPPKKEAKSKKKVVIEEAEEEEEEEEEEDDEDDD